MNGSLGQARRSALVLFVVAWSALSLVRLSRLVEPAEVPIGEIVRPFIPFALEVVPEGAAYVYVEPRAYGGETGVGPRLRYELYPRRYDDLSGLPDEASVRLLARRNGAQYIVVPDAALYPADYFLLQPRPWFRRVALDARRFVLVVDSP